MTASSRPTDAPAIEVHARPGLPLGMPAEDFLRRYWQKHPLLIRGAFPEPQLPIEPDDLGGLACEEGVLARIAIHDPASGAWTLRQGPFQESDFAELPEDHWTLLVQDVDKWDADVAQWLQPFAFLPSWRIDDIMISYAEQGGGVGPHVDQYDVFLIQGLGQRAWAIDSDPDTPRHFRPDIELKQLQVFTASHRWVLEPGDVLYLPPGVPHDGIAEGGPCMTLSVGMRAPSQAELTGDLADYLAERLNEDQRYTDPDLAPASRPGEIDAVALQRVRRALPMAAALSDAVLLDWFGRFVTRYRAAQTPAISDEELSPADVAARLARGEVLLRHPWARLAWGQAGAQSWLFACGQAYPVVDPATAALLCGPSPELRLPPPAPTVELLTRLINDGQFVLGGTDD
ncbi:JmjC domain-containing protein [Frateuria aurantia]